MASASVTAHLPSPSDPQTTDSLLERDLLLTLGSAEDPGHLPLGEPRPGDVRLSPGARVPLSMGVGTGLWGLRRDVTDAGGWESPALELSGRDGAAVCGQSGGVISRRRPGAESCPASSPEALLSPERPLDTLSPGVQSGHPCPCNPSDPTLISAVPVWRGRRCGLQRTHGLRTGVPSSSHPAAGPGEWPWGLGSCLEPSLQGKPLFPTWGAHLGLRSLGGCPVIPAHLGALVSTRRGEGSFSGVPCPH